MESPAKKAIVIGMDGASMEIVKNMVDWGHMPNLAKLVERGAWRPMVGVFPTLTPPGWTAVSTGSWPGNHEVMDFNIRALGERLDQTVWGIDTGLSKSEYIWNTFERAGKTPILVKWEMSWPPTVTTGYKWKARGPACPTTIKLRAITCLWGASGRRGDWSCSATPKRWIRVPCKRSRNLIP